MAFESDAAAAEALASANSGDISSADAALMGEQAPAQTQDTGTVDAGTNQSSESFTTLDLSDVPEEFRPLVEGKFSQFNSDYTRKTQEIAPLRSALTDHGFSAEEAAQVLQSVRALDDPANARALWEQLNGQFGEQQHVQNEFEQQFGEEVDPRDQQINDLSGRLERFEQQQALAEARSQLTEAVSAVKAANTDWKDADIERVQRLAVVHMNNGSDVSRAMTQAADDYKSWRSDVLSGYIDGKGTVQADGRTPVLGSSPHAQTPGRFESLEDATKAALAAFGNDWVQ